ncbi:hypothetical protein [Allostreptomyces psammosilenae]|uniref:Ada DNA repair metal-binding domain-containing protein n=1 Tax=Allostreptomyces psammosilenae TaxID=1892865 RepID=A0A853A0E5_9ACTN|nr:hypothetical protein [Allostreptomyces psammosilenae]NYI06404.1 hypothetical protein [Allostreptomyces psammosilenae]
MGNVYVRIGIYRYAYHTDLDCPALNGKPETYQGREELAEEEARAQGLRACRQCKR